MIFLKISLAQKENCMLYSARNDPQTSRDVHAESERGNTTNAEQDQGGESLTTEYVRRSSSHAVNRRAKQNSFCAPVVK